MAEYLDSYAVYAYYAAGWTAITGDIISDIDVSWGSAALRRRTGWPIRAQMSFTLINQTALTRQAMRAQTRGGDGAARSSW